MEYDFKIMSLIVFVGFLLSAVGLSLIPVRLKILLSSDVKKLTVKFWKLTILDSEKRSSELGGKQEVSNESVAEGKREIKTSGVGKQTWKSVQDIAQVAPRVLGATLEYLIGVIRRISLRDVRGSICGGLADPAETGMVFGALYAICGAAPGLRSRLLVKPDYMAERIEYNLTGEFSFRPLALVGPTIKFMYVLPKRELVKMLWSRRKTAKGVAALTL